MKTVNGHTRYVLEALEHKIAPRVRKVRELLEGFSSEIFDQVICHKIKKELDKLETGVTKLILREMNKDRKK